MTFVDQGIVVLFLVISLSIWEGLRDLEEEISKSVQKKISGPGPRNSVEHLRPLLDHLRAAPNTVIVTETHGGTIVHQVKVPALQTYYHGGWKGPEKTRPEY